MAETLAAAERDDPVPGLTEPYPVDGDLLVEAPERTGSTGEDGPKGERRPSEADGGVPAATAERSPRTEQESTDAVLDRHADHWYEPDSKTYAYAVRTPDGDRAYRKTAAGAASVLRRYYGDD